MSDTRLVISGSVAIDRVMNFSGQYRDLINADKLHVLSVSVLVDSYDQAQGGTGANIAHSLALLGDNPVLLGSVGKDADIYIERLGSEGVDTSKIHVSELATASFNVLTDSDGNQIGGFYPGAMSDAESLSFLGFKDSPALFCISAHDPAAMRRQVEECSANNLRLFYDPGQQVSNLPAEDLKAGALAAELLIVNDYEMGLLCKKTGLSQDDIFGSTDVVVITHGAEGSTISGRKLPEPVNIQSSSPMSVVDPTGAGDAYRAGFLYGYLRQWDVSQCGQLGSVVATFALEQHGPQAQISKPAVQSRYQQTYGEEIIF
jgi:adenosine kinase